MPTVPRLLYKVWCILDVKKTQASVLKGHAWIQGIGKITVLKNVQKGVNLTRMVIEHVAFLMVRVILAARIHSMDHNAQVHAVHNAKIRCA